MEGIGRAELRAWCQGQIARYKVRALLNRCGYAMLLLLLLLLLPVVAGAQRLLQERGRSDRHSVFARDAPSGVVSRPESQPPRRCTSL